MRVLVLTSSFPRFQGDSSGVFLYHLCKELQTLGVKISVVTPHDYGYERHEFWKGIEIHRFPYFYPLKSQKLCYGSGVLKNLQEWPPILIQLPFFIISEIVYVCRIIQKGKFDLVHAHWSIPQGFTGLIMNKLFGIPWVTSLHGSDVYGLKAPLLRALNSRIIRRSNACTANSRATSDEARRIAGRDDIQVIPMGVDIEVFRRVTTSKRLQSGVDKKEQTILFAGRLIEWKGVDYLVRAFAAVLKKNQDVRLVIVGSGPEESSLISLSRELNIQHKVQFQGAVSQDQLPGYYSMADVFVLPSVVTEAGETEGLGVVLLEAMACGVPVIGSAVGGIPDIIEDEETGLLALQKNPEDLADKINRLLTDEDLRKKVTEKGFQFVREEFSWDVVARKFKGIYDDLLLQKTPFFPINRRC